MNFVPIVVACSCCIIPATAYQLGRFFLLPQGWLCSGAADIVCSARCALIMSQPAIVEAPQVLPQQDPPPPAAQQAPQQPPAPASQVLPQQPPPPAAQPHTQAQQPAPPPAAPLVPTSHVIQLGPAPAEPAAQLGWTETNGVVHQVEAPR